VISGQQNQSDSTQLYIQYGSAIKASDGTIVADIFGSGFNPQSVAMLNDHASPTLWLSASHLQSTIALADVAGMAFAARVKESESSSRQSNTVQISVPETAGNSAPAALPFASSVGCENPYIGRFTNWGDSTQFQNGAIYVDVDLSGPNVGSPNYVSNAIFWISRETKPSQSVVMTGAFTSAPKTVKLAQIPEGTQDWRALVRNSPTSVLTIQDRVNGLSFTIPPTFQTGVYGFEIDSPDAEPIMGLANVPSIAWWMGVPSATDPVSALQHAVHPCGAEPGETLRLFGKNFAQAQSVVLQDSDGNLISLKPSHFDSNSISAVLPGTLPVGTYSLWVGSDTWDAVSSQPVLITIVSSPGFSVNTYQCTSLSGDGNTDDTANLQSCLDRYAPAAQSHEISLIAIPEGVFLLSGGITLRPYEAIIGSSSESTKFAGSPKGLPPTAWIQVSHHAGIANLTFNAPVNPYLFVSSDRLDISDKAGISGIPGESGDIFVSNVHLETTGRVSDAVQSEMVFAASGPDLQIYDSTFRTSHSGTAEWQASTFDSWYVDGAVISGSTFVDTDAYFGFASSQNIIVERNEAYSAEGTGPAGGMAFSISRPFGAFSPRAHPARNVYLGYNYFHDIGWPDQNVIQTDGGASAYFGSIEQSSAAAITLAQDPSWIWTSSNPLGLSVEIVSGKGAGQFSMVKSIDGRMIELITPLAVIPDESSLVQITDPKINLIFSHNRIADAAPVGILIYGGVVDSVIEDNDFEDNGRGLQFWAFGPYGGYLSDFNNDILRNNLTAGTGRWIKNSTSVNPEGLGIGDMPGCFVSGLLMRENRVPFNQTIYATQYSNGIVENMIEQNHANVLHMIETPGFIVQDNSPR
jgi:hypothetical protein